MAAAPVSDRVVAPVSARVVVAAPVTDPDRVMGLVLALVRAMLPAISHRRNNPPAATTCLLSPALSRGERIYRRASNCYVINYYLKGG
jgi:hypothetical protein